MRSLPIRVDVQTSTSSSYDGDGFLSLGVDGEGDNTALQPVEAMPPLGIFARPIDPGTDGQGNPLAGKSCSVIRLIGDNDDQAIPVTDPRVVGLLPRLGKGAVCVYEPTCFDDDGVTAVTDLARVTINDNGSHRIVVHAPASTTPTKIVIEIEGGPTVTVDGTTSPPNVTVAAGGTTLTVDATGVQAGAPGGTAVALASPDLISWIAAVSGVTNVPQPASFMATLLKAT